MRIIHFREDLFHLVLAAHAEEGLGFVVVGLIILRLDTVVSVLAHEMALVARGIHMERVTIVHPTLKIHRSTILRIVVQVVILVWPVILVAQLQHLLPLLFQLRGIRQSPVHVEFGDGAPLEVPVDSLQHPLHILVHLAINSAVLFLVMKQIVGVVAAIAVAVSVCLTSTIHFISNLLAFSELRKLALDPLQITIQRFDQNRIVYTMLERLLRLIHDKDRIVEFERF